MKKNCIKYGTIQHLTIDNKQFTLKNKTILRCPLFGEEKEMSFQGAFKG